MSRIVKFSLVLAILATAGVAGFAVWRALPERQRVFTDADTIHAPAAGAQIRDVLWQPPVALPQTINGTQNDYEPRLSFDGMTLFFVRGKAGENADILISRRTPDGWSEPAPAEGINSEDDELGPEPSADGALLYFYSDRAGGVGGYDIWVARARADGGFDPPTNLGGLVNSAFNDYGPAIAPDARTLYFSSNRPRPQEIDPTTPGAWPATVREDLFNRHYDLYAAPLSDAGAGRAVPLAKINTEHNEGSPAVSPAGDFIYFSSDRPGGAGGFDLYRARRLRGELTAPENLGVAVNTVANELDPGLASNGFTLLFSSDRPAGRVVAGRPPDYNIYRSHSREVFLDVTEHARAPIDWWGLWNAIAPNLLWALLALTLLLLLLLLLLRSRDRRLSLIMKCLLGSLALHLLLMLLFNFWEVTASIMNALDDGGGVQIALVSPARGSDITTQIRGELTEAASMTPAPTDVQRTDVTVEISLPAPSVAALEVHRTPVPVESPAPAESLVDDAPLPLTEIATAAPTKTSPSEDATAVNTLDVSTPADANPVNESESDALEDASSHIVNTRVAERAPPASVVVASEAPSARVDLAPAERPDDARDESTASLANPTRVDDARPSSTPRRAAGPIAAVSSAKDVASTEISLSTPTEATRPNTADGASSEAEAPAVGAVAASAPRRPVTSDDVGATRAGEIGVQSLEPQRVDAAETGGSLAPTTPEKLADASSGRASLVNPSAPPRPGLPPAPAEELDLPELEVSADASDSHGDGIDVAAAEATAPRADVVPTTDGDRAAAAGKPTVAEIEPARDAAAADDSLSLALASLPRRDRDGLPRTAPPILSPVDREGLFDAPIEIDIPRDIEPVESKLPQRAPDHRDELLERMGGSEETERAVAAALVWLARHQSADGHWDGDGFDAGCGECDGDTPFDVDVGLTGLGLLCFLGADHTHAKDGPYRENVRRAIDWLIAKQGSDGDLRGPETMYSQGIATIALSEAYAMTGDARLEPPVRRAVQFIEGARNSVLGGWRYEPGQPGDTSVLGWQIMALKSAQMAGIEVEPAAFASAQQWLALVADPQQPGRYKYQPQREVTRAMTAEAMFTRQLLGVPRNEPTMALSEAYIREPLPDWSDANTYEWYYTTLALFHHQSTFWPTWNTGLSRALIDSQRSDGKAAGSWDPVGKWASTGGRVYQTAICALMLEVYYRYLPLQSFEESAPPPGAIGTIRGRVTDAATGEPLAGAGVRLDISSDVPLMTLSRDDGSFVLYPPALPDHIAMSASKDGYVPATVSVSTAELGDQTVGVDFLLERATERVVAVETDPQVHHLGNDRWEGQINSQFQKTSEGLRYHAQFALSAEQLSPRPSRCEVWMMTKGVQCPHEVYVNGQQLDAGLNRSPGDGSFGENAVDFDASLLRVGENTIEIQDISCSGDLDDFEFVNLQIRLHP